MNQHDVLGEEQSRLVDAFSDSPALISYIAAGDPSTAATKRFARALVEGGTDVLELGLPFSEPIAEGPTIQSALQRSLDSGMTPSAYLDLVENLDVDVPVVCMTYYNLIHTFGEEPGPEAFVSAAAAAGISGFVIPDLPLDESEAMRTACQTHGLDLVFIVAPTTTNKRLERILELTTGFVYVQGRIGTTGTRKNVGSDVHDSLDRLTNTDIPNAVGFGISSGEHAQEVISAGADGVIVGSSYVKEIASGVKNNQSTDQIATNLETLACELKAGIKRGADGYTESPEPQRR